MANKTCLVTGATGAVGPSVVAALCEAGYRVSALCRNAPRSGLLPSDVEVTTADIGDVAAVRSAVAGKDVVVHLASLLHINDPTEAECAEFHRVNVVGTGHVVDAAVAEGVQRVVLMSTIAVYGYGQGGTLHEGSPTLPETTYGQTKLEAERYALAAKRADGMPLTAVLRLAAVYGPRIKGNYQTLLRALARGRFVPIGRGDNRRTLVHTDDVAAAVVLAAQHVDAAGGVFNVTDGEFHSLRTILEEMCRALGRGVPAVVIPVLFARVAVAGVDAVVLLAGKRLSLRGMLNKYLEEVAVDGHKIQKDLGFRPALDLRSGWARTVRDLREAGEL